MGSFTITRTSKNRMCLKYSYQSVDKPTELIVLKFSSSKCSCFLFKLSLEQFLFLFIEQMKQWDRKITYAANMYPFNHFYYKWNDFKDYIIIEKKCCRYLNISVQIHCEWSQYSDEMAISGQPKSNKSKMKWWTHQNKSNHTNAWSRVCSLWTAI